MSFWKQSPGPHWSHTFSTLMGNPKDPHVFQESFEKPTFAYTVLTKENVVEIYTLLQRHFSMYPRSKISLSKEQIIDFLDKEGCIAVGIFFNLSLVGVLFSRPLGFLMIGSRSVNNQKIGMIDFFCVHEKFRKKGIGSKLLNAMAYECLQRGYVAHLFLKEGMPLTSLPPLYSSNYIWRPRKIPAPVNLSNFIRPATALPRDSPFWNAPSAVFHTKIYECFAFQPPVFIGVTDLFHHSEPEGKTMGELSWVWFDPLKGDHKPDKLQRIVETVVDSYSGYDMIFMDSNLPHDRSQWITDALFSYYAWNLHPGTFFKTKPALTF